MDTYTREKAPDVCSTLLSHLTEIERRRKKRRPRPRVDTGQLPPFRRACILGWLTKDTAFSYAAEGIRFVHIRKRIRAALRARH